MLNKKKNQLIKSIIRKSFLQLLAVYTILVMLSLLGVIPRFILHFEIFAVILAVMAVVSIKKGKQVKIPKYWLVAAIALVLFFRIIPYIDNTIPLGYDPGIYKYAIDNPLSQEEWMKEAFEPGFLLIASFLKYTGFSTYSILTSVLIFFEVVLGLMIYFVTKKFFNAQSGILAFLLYAVSLTQFKAFAFCYYKQVLGLILLLVSVYFLKMKEEKASLSHFILLMVSASFLGAVHRPTFLIFGLVFVVYVVKKLCVVKSFKDFGLNALLGLLILVSVFLFYIGRIKEALLAFVFPVITGNMGSGTFLNFTEYQMVSVIYLPFSLLGLFHLAKKKDFNLLFLWFLVNGAIVFLKLFFYNRYIVSLDVVMIIFAGYGFYLLIRGNNKLGACITILLVVLASSLVFLEAMASKPMIAEEELDIIISLKNTTEAQAFLMSTDSYYSPWLQGYSGRRVIAPGLFDYDNWTRDEWGLFWNSTNVSELLGRYEKPLYLFAGREQFFNFEIVNAACLSTFLVRNNTFIYVCR